MRQLCVLLAAVCLFVLTGCEQTQNTFFINPDGTGKLVYTATFPLDIDTPNFNNKKPRTDDQKVADALKNVLTRSVGVDAWSGVSCAATPDGLILFKGTAYFHDLTTLKIGTLSGQSADNVRLEFAKTGKGYRFAVLQGKDEKKDDGKTAATTAAEDNKPKTKEAVLQAVRRARTAWKYTRPMLSVILGNDVRTYTIVAPKPAKSVQGFTPTKDGYTFTFDGAKMLKAMDELFAKSDDALAALTAQVELKDSKSLTEYFAKQFGFDPPHEPSVEIETEAPLFDYAKELAAARDTSAALLAKVRSAAQGSSDATAATPTGNGTIKSVRVQAINRSFPENEKDSGNTTLSLSVAFDGAVTSLSKVELTELTDATGKAVAAKESGCNGNLSENGTSCAITCSLPSDLTGIGRIAGTLTYSVGSGSNIVDLGTIETKKGAKGSALEAEIDNQGNGWLHLKFKGDKAMVKGFQFMTSDGTPYKVSEFQLSEWQGYCTKTLRPAEGDQWPEKLHIKIELFTASKSFTAPWSMQDITLPQAGK